MSRNSSRGLKEGGGAGGEKGDRVDGRIRKTRVGQYIIHILNKPYDSPSAPLFAELGWLPLSLLSDSSLISHVALSLKSLNPSYFDDLFKKPQHLYSTRFSSNNFSLPHCLHDSSVLARSIRAWNQLEIKPDLTLRPGCKNPAASLRKRTQFVISSVINN